MESQEQEQIKSLIELVESEELDELTIQDGEETIRIRRGGDRCLSSGPGSSFYQAVLQQGASLVGEALAHGAAGGGPEGPASGPQLTGVAETNPNHVHIISPMVGVFFRASAPGSPSFVEVGSMVEEGQTIGIVEAMKVFNEITAEVHGRVLAIPAKNEQLVQHGDTLVIIVRVEA